MKSKTAKTAKTGKSINAIITKTNSDKSLDELKAELEYLSAENAYLKKLDALSQQRQHANKLLKTK